MEGRRFLIFTSMSWEVRNLAEVLFYLTVQPLEKIVPVLAEKVVTSGEKGLLLVEDNRECLRWDQLLWTYSTASFLPHAREDQEKDGAWVSRQPLLISSTSSQANHASVILNLKRESPLITAEVRKILEISSVYDDLVEKYKNYGALHPHFNLQMWKQTKDGRWHKESMQQAA